MKVAVALSCFLIGITLCGCEQRNAPTQEVSQQTTTRSKYLFNETANSADYRNGQEMIPPEPPPTGTLPLEKLPEATHPSDPVTRIAPMGSVSPEIQAARARGIKLRGLPGG